MPRVSKVEKLVSILATSTLMTGAREETLKRIPYIYYLVHFKDINKTQVQNLIDSGSEVNTIYLTFVKKLGLSIKPTEVGMQKIDSTTLDIYRMVVAVFLVTDKAYQVRFFEKTFMVANVSPEVVFRIPFLILSGTDIDFSG